MLINLKYLHLFTDISGYTSYLPDLLVPATYLDVNISLKVFQHLSKQIIFLR